MPYLLKDTEYLIRQWVRHDSSAIVSEDVDENLQFALNWYEKTEGWKVINVWWSGLAPAGINKLLLHKN